MKRLASFILVFVVAAGAYLAFWPVPIDPVAWTAPVAPELEGRFAVNDALAGVERIGAGIAVGPEDVAVDTRGRIYGSYADGRIRRFSGVGGNAEVFANTGGRPLGMTWTHDDSLVVADALRGLLTVRPDGEVQQLADGAAGVPFGFTDDVDVSSDGTIYFSDASHKFGPDDVMADILEHGGNGRLLRYDVVSGETEVLLDGLQFANGVAVGPDDRYLLVCETGAYRIVRYWLKGPNAGQHEVFIDNLPGFPDNVSFNGDNTFWAAIYAPRNQAIDFMSDKPWLRRIAYLLPEALQPAPAHHAFVLGFDVNGRVDFNLQDLSAAAYAPITSVKQVGNVLYLGSLTYDAIGRLPVPEPGAGVVE